jgi:hypothetical protein
MHRRRRSDQIAHHIVELEKRISQLSNMSDLNEAFSNEEIRAIYDLLPQYRALLRQEMTKRAKHGRESCKDGQQIA